MANGHSSMVSSGRLLCYSSVCFYACQVCMANGYSSMVFDERVFVSFNPCAPTPLPLHPCIRAAKLRALVHCRCKHGLLTFYYVARSFGM